MSSLNNNARTTLDSQQVDFTNAMGHMVNATMYAWPILSVGKDSSGNLVPLLVGSTGGFVLAPPSTTPTGLSNFRSLLVNSTAVAVKASAGNVFGINITNRHSAAIAVKLYDEAAATVDPGTDIPKHVFLVQANGSLILRGVDLPFSFATAIAVRCVTDLTDTGTTAPATLPIIEIDYK